MKYNDFDIRIAGESAGAWTVYARSTEEGEAEVRFTLQLDDPQLSEQLGRLAHRDTDRAQLAALGAKLYDTVFYGAVGVCLQRSYGAASHDEELGLRVRLRIRPAELKALPWELMYSLTEGEFLSTRIDSPVVRYLEIPKHKRKLATSFPLRILVAIPKGADPSRLVDVRREKQVIEKALKRLRAHVQLEYLHEAHADRRVTWTRLHERLTEQPNGQRIACFHFIGHGAFGNDRGHLVLDGEDDRDDIVPDTRFAGLFKNVASMKLVVLNACQGAAVSSSRPLSGVAARLVEAGVPAVVAMQFSIRDDASVDFARSFYHSLFRSAERGRVDVAISQGRKVLAENYRDERELAAPVLLTHTDDCVLFLPELASEWRNVPTSRRELHTMQAAHAATDDADEATRFLRRITLAKRGAKVGFAMAMLAFCMSWINLLDILTIDTRAEFLVMALGSALADKPVSEDLRIVTLDAQGLSTAAIREREAGVLQALAAGGARVVAMDAWFASEGGAFRVDPESGARLVAAIRDAAPTRVVLGARTLVNQSLSVPAALEAAAAGVGHLCVESKLNLARSLPIAVAMNEAQLPSLALSAYAAFHGGKVLSGTSDPDALAVVLFDNAPSKRFTVSEIKTPRRVSRNCPLIAPGTIVAHRFLQLNDPQRLSDITATAAQVAALARQPERLRQRYADKLVVVGLLGVGDVIADRSGDRPGVFWQADAINNLLLDVEIRPLGGAGQLAIMLGLGVIGAMLRLQFEARKVLGIAAMIAVTAALVLVVVYTYGRYVLLVNPAYQLVAFWLAWWLAGRLGKTWLQ